MKKEFTKLWTLTILLMLFNMSAKSQVITALSEGWENSEVVWSSQSNITNKIVKTDGLGSMTGSGYMYGQCATGLTGRIYNSTAPTYTWTSGLRYFVIYWTKTDIASTASFGWGTTGSTPTTSLSANTWTRITSSYLAGSGSKTLNPTYTTTAATQIYIDNVVLYSNSNTSATIDLTAPTSPIFGACTTSQLNWTNGTDGAGTEATGIAATILLSTTNLNASAPVLQAQAPYMIGQNPAGLTAGSTDWSIVSNSIEASATNYTMTTNTNTQYALIHRDYAYNYSTAALLIPVSISTQPIGSIYNQNDIAAALSVSATGTGLTCQWYSNITQSTTGATLLSGQTNATYTPPTGTAGTIYYYCVVTGNLGAITSNIVTVVTNSVTILDTPAVSNATNVTNQGFTANWGNVNNATSYIVKIYQAGNEVTSARQSVTGTSIDISGLTSNTTYTFTVIAVAGGYGNSVESSASNPVRTLNNVKAITAFNIPTQISSTINEGAKTILIYVPVGTNLTSLSPTVTVSNFATVRPQTLAVQDFTASVTYTVTAEDLSTQDYTVTVAIGSSPTDYFQSIATGNWSDKTIWQSSASTSGPWMTATAAPTSSSQGVLIINGYMVTVNSATTTPATSVDGTSTLRATAAITLGAALSINGTYEHAMDGGVIPTATWNSGSTCLVDGVTSNITTGTDQDFCNFTWNCPSQTASHTSNLWSDGRHITGNVILTTGTGNLRIISMAAGIKRSVTIDGNFTITKGTGTSSIVYTNGSSASGTAQLNIGGDFITSTGSTFYFNNGAGHSACMLNLSSNFSNGGTLTSLLSTDIVTINFVKSGVQTYVNSGTFTSLTALTININNGSMLSLTNNLSTTTLNINSGAKLTNNATLTATTFNILSNSTNGTGTFLDNGTTTAITANVNQYLTTGRNWYISSPVSGATSSVFNVPTNQLYWYDETNGNSATLNWPLITANTSLNVGQGYVANLTASNPVTFTGGSLNTGSITSPVLTSTPAADDYQGYNLVGNPYPSYVNWNSVTKTNVSNTMWYRTQESGGTYKFYTYNTVDGTGIGVPATVTSYIPPMQAFWVLVTSGTGTLGFDNTMRSHQDVAGNAFRAPAAKNSESEVLRLNISNGTNDDEAVVYFNANASNEFDKYDSPKMSNNIAVIPEIYTTVGNEKLVINGMNSITTDTEIPLGFTTGQSNAFSIKASEFSNFDSDTKVYLKDNLLNTVQDLTDGSAYTFASDVASTTSRFSIVFKSVGMTTGLQAAANDPSVLIYKNAYNQIAVNCTGSISDNGYVSVYNALGQKLEMKKIAGTTTVIDRAFSSGVYVVTVNNGGKSTTKKVILN